MVGDFPSLDDSQCQKTLRKIKSIRPKTLDLEHRTTTSQTLAALRHIGRTLRSSDEEAKQKGPMAKAFATPNPRVSIEKIVSQNLDPAIKKLNEGLPYSLMRCDAPYTLKVATFRGSSQFEKIDQPQKKRPKKRRSRLAIATENAHLLTSALRERGYEAYQFHDHDSSIVTVGSFASGGSRLADGRWRVNPQVQVLMDTFRADRGPRQTDANVDVIMQRYAAIQKQKVTAAHITGIYPKTLQDISAKNGLVERVSLAELRIPFDINPELIKIPHSATGRPH